MGGPGFIDEKVHEETDNFQAVNFKINDETYCSAENYFQCAKTTTKEEHELVRKSGPGIKAWNAGSKVKLRENWDAIKVNEMYIGNKAKFDQNPDLSKLLTETIGKVKFTGSTNFWNYWNGLIMERLRAEIRKNGEEDLKVVYEITELMEKYQQNA